MSLENLIITYKSLWKDIKVKKILHLDPDKLCN